MTITMQIWKQLRRLLRQLRLKCRPMTMKTTYSSRKNRQQDLSASDLDVLSVYGSEDTVLNAEKYNENKINLPDEFCEVVIDGGCHAYFGAYGMQEGDGEPGITCEEQTDITVKNITEFINKI